MHFMPMLRKLSFPFIIAAAAFSPTYAQHQSAVAGQITDAAGIGLADAIVNVLSHQGDSLYVSVLTDKDGKFLMPSTLTSGTLLIEISCSGYEKQRAFYTQGMPLSFRLTQLEKIQELGEATVSATKSTFKKEKNKFMFVPHGVDLQLPDVFQLMRNVPLLSVGETGSVSVLGKGTSTIYINGDKPLETGDALQARLKALSPADVKKIEIIRSPGSKYSADTQGAIVNIVLRDPEEGWAGRAGITGSYAKERLSSNEFLSFRFAHGRFDNYISASWNTQNSHNSQTDSYTYALPPLTLRNEQTSSDKWNSGTLSWYGNYQMTKRQKLLAAVTVNTRKNDGHGTTQTVRQGADDAATSVSRTLTNNDVPWTKPIIGGSLGYRYNGEKTTVRADAQYSNYEQRTKETLQYQQGAADDVFSTYQQLRQDKKSENRYGLTKVDLHHAFDNSNSLDVNYQGDYTHTDNDLSRQNDAHADGTWTEDASVSNRFVYKEMVQALNASYSRDWNDVLSTEIGIRAEYTHAKGTQHSTGEMFTRKGLEWYPSASISLDLADGDHSLSFDYSRSVVRPFLSNLNPFVTRISENTYRKGNPQQKDSHDHTLSLEYSFLSHYTFLFDYTYSKDALNDYEWTDGEGNTYFSTLNFGHSHAFSWSFNYNNAFFDQRYIVNASAEADYERVYGLIDGVKGNYTDVSYEARINNRFVVSKKKAMQCTLGYTYISPSRGITRKFNANHSIMASFVKQFDNGAGLEASAFWGIVKNTTTFSSEAFSYRFANHVSGANFSLTFVYPFGGKQVRRTSALNTNNASDRFSK